MNVKRAFKGSLSTVKEAADETLLLEKTMIAANNLPISNLIFSTDRKWRKPKPYLEIPHDEADDDDKSSPVIIRDCDEE